MSEFDIETVIEASSAALAIICSTKGAKTFQDNYKGFVADIFKTAIQSALTPLKLACDSKAKQHNDKLENLEKSLENLKKSIPHQLNYQEP